MNTDGPAINAGNGLCTEDSLTLGVRVMIPVPRNAQAQKNGTGLRTTTG